MFAAFEALLFFWDNGFINGLRRIANSVFIILNFLGRGVNEFLRFFGREEDLIGQIELYEVTIAGAADATNMLSDAAGDLTVDLQH